MGRGPDPGPAGPPGRDSLRLDGTRRPIQHRGVVALAEDPTIRRQVMAAAREVLAADPEAPIERISRAAGVSRATFYRHFGSRAALLGSVAHEPRPEARERILAAAQDMLLRSSLGQLSMDELARAAEVSRGSLYRIFPGKAALLHGLIDTYSPFEAVRRLLAERGDQPPEVVVPLIAREIVGVAGERAGLLRTVFLEVTAASETGIDGMSPSFSSTLGLFAGYLERQMAAGRIRRMHPFLALQAAIGPVIFHLLTRPAADRLVPLPMSPADAVDELVAASLEGLRP
jgi:AcrR family transcriptional regulator